MRWRPLLGGPTSEKLGVEGIGNLCWTLISKLALAPPVRLESRFPMLRTQVEATCATPLNAPTNFGYRALSRSLFHYNPRHRGRARMLAALLCTVAFGEVFVGDEAATPQFFKVR